MTRRLSPLLLVLAGGCSQGNTDFWRQPADLSDLMALPNRVAVVDKTSALAFVLDPADPALRPRLEKVGKAPVKVVTRNGSSKLVVLSKGDRGAVGKAPVPAELDIIDADPAVPVERHLLDGRFDTLDQSPDGRFLVLYHSPDGEAQSESAVFDLNEMLIVDFVPQDGSGITRLTGKSIRSWGSMPSRIVFSPAYPFLGGGRTLAAVFSDNYVTILDLDNPNRTEITVPLCPTSTGCNASPKLILFDPASLNLYVGASGATDIFQIALTDLRANGGVAPAEPSNDFRASASMLAVGAEPADMVLYGSGADTRLAVAAPNARRLVIIDPGTSHTTAIATSIPVSRIIPFAVPGTEPPYLPKPQALLVDSKQGSTTVLFADLASVESTGGLALKDYAIGASVQDPPQPLVDQDMVVLMSDSRSGNSAVTVVNLTAQSFKQIGSGTSLAHATVETRNPSRLWGVTSGSLLSFLNLVPRAGEPVGTGETWLDQPIISITPLVAPSADGRRYLVVGHDDPNRLGNLTFLDADRPDRATARTAHGFLLTDYLEREQP